MYVSTVWGLSHPLYLVHAQSENDDKIDPYPIRP